MQSQWAKLAGFIVGYQATWIADIGLPTGPFLAIADAGAGISDTDVAADWISTRGTCSCAAAPTPSSSSTPPVVR